MNENIFINKNVLLIATAFFGYEKRTQKQIEELGGNVYLFNERSVESSIDRALIKVNPNIYKKRTISYYKSIVEKLKNVNIDFVYIYGATMIDCDIVNLLKQNFKCPFILYLADSVKNNKRYEKMFPLFDWIKTFDRKDYIYYKKKFSNFHFLPLFYSPEYQNDEKRERDYKYDLCFIGTIHSDRWDFIRKIKKQAEDNGLSVFCYAYLQSKFMFFYHLIFNRKFTHAHYSDFNYDKMSISDVKEHMLNSKVIVDVQYPKNSGLTMRTIETMGLRRKLITANKDIKNYDFYNQKNILIVDRENPIINKEFVITPYEEVDSDIYESYSLKNWVLNLFSNDGVE